MSLEKKDEEAETVVDRVATVVESAKDSPGLQVTVVALAGLALAAFAIWIGG